MKIIEIEKSDFKTFGEIIRMLTLNELNYTAIIDDERNVWKIEITGY
jgi:hypothetical protein